MEVARILDLRQFDRRALRFRDLPYRNSSRGTAAPTPDGKGGFSVIATACACPSLDGDCICAHIARYYSQQAPEPCAFVMFSTDDFRPMSEKQKAVEMVQVPSSTGDPCHYNMHNVSDNRLEKKLRRKEAEPAMRLCVAGGTCEPYSPERAVDLYNEHFPDPL